jgi:hypothetical protein
MRHHIKLRAVTRAARYVWWMLALVAHERGGDTIRYVNHHDVYGTAGLEAWEEGDKAGGESIVGLVDALRDAELIQWDDEARVISLLLTLPMLGEDSDDGGGYDADAGPARAPAGGSTGASVGAVRSTTSAPGTGSTARPSRAPSSPSGDAHAKVLKNARCYFKKRERRWRDVPQGVSFESWLASPDGLAWQTEQGMVAPVADTVATSPATNSATDATTAQPGCNKVAAPPSPGPSPSEKEEKREDNNQTSDARGATQPG